MQLHNWRFRIAALALSAAFAACSSGESAPTAPGSSLIRVAGTYATSVALGESSCPGIVVQNVATTVTHTAGATDFSLQQVAISASGSVLPDGTFGTDRMNVAVGDAMHNLVIIGKFTVSGFEAVVTVTVVQPTAPQSCVYQLGWLGTKQGTPNTIPGP